MIRHNGRELILADSVGEIPSLRGFDQALDVFLTGRGSRSEGSWRKLNAREFQKRSRARRLAKRRS